MKSSSLFFLLAFFFVALSSSSSSNVLLAGIWSPIMNPTDPHVGKVAEFAVLDYNRRAKPVAYLELTRVVRGETQVVKGETQVVNGIKYNLVIEATNGRSYKALVWEKPTGKPMELLSFNYLRE